MIKLMAGKINKTITGMILTGRKYLITEKFYNGQGGEINFDLTNRQYHVTV